VLNESVQQVVAILRMVQFFRGEKINSSYIRASVYLSNQSLPAHSEQFATRQKKNPYMAIAM
jgi:hypothetical protein